MLFPARDQSPSQIKKPLESHLEDTNKRLELIGNIGEKLIAQKEQLADRIKEVGSQNGDEITPELKQRLADLEREYNEVGKESARAFMSSKTATQFGNQVSRIQGNNRESS